MMLIFSTMQLAKGNKGYDILVTAKKLNWTPGKGLGAREDGRTSPVPINRERQRSRHGLGYRNEPHEPHYIPRWNETLPNDRSTLVGGFYSWNEMKSLEVRNGERKIGEWVKKNWGVD